MKSILILSFCFISSFSHSAQFKLIYEGREYTEHLTYDYSNPDCSPVQSLHPKEFDTISFNTQEELKEILEKSEKIYWDNLNCINHYHFDVEDYWFLSQSQKEQILEKALELEKKGKLRTSKLKVTFSKVRSNDLMNIKRENIWLRRGKKVGQGIAIIPLIPFAIVGGVFWALGDVTYQLGKEFFR